MLELNPEEIRRRKTELVERYAEPVRLMVAYSRIYGQGEEFLTKSELEEEAKNILISIVIEIDVVKHWPPDEITHAQVDQIVQKYINSIR
jgi:hypothetical protein